ncbi:MAG: hypothetical protein MK105_06320 [Crocinitomicaceae bacterium]|nr:hypothetical protein [Crocinitomicaceae bacterium]
MKLALFVFFMSVLPCQSQDNGWHSITLPEGQTPEIDRQKSIWTKYERSLDQTRYYDEYDFGKPKSYRSFPKARKAKGTFKSYPLKVDEILAIKNSMLYRDDSKMNIKYLDKSHGFYTNSVNGVFEGDDGQMYFSSLDGLGVYDGEKIKVYRGKKEFPITDIREMSKDNSGRIWLSLEHGVAYIENGTVYYCTGISSPVWHVRKGIDNDYWIGTQLNGLYQWKDNQLYHYYADNMTEVFDVFFMPDGKMWIGFNKSIAYLEDGKLNEWIFENGDRTARSFFKDENTLWIGSFAGGIHKYENGKLIHVYTGHENRSFYDVKKTKDGLWFTCYGDGLILLKNDGNIYRVMQSDGLVDRHSYKMTFDRNGNIWVADLIGGISRIDKTPLLSLTGRGFMHRIVDIRNDQERTWYFSSGGDLCFDEGNIRYRLDNEGNATFPKIRHINCGYPIAHKEMWCGSLGPGLIKVTPSKFTIYHLKGSFYNNDIQTLQCDEQGRVWYSNRYGQLRLMDNEIIFDVFKSPEFKGKNFPQLYKLSNGRILAIGSEVCLLKDLQFKKIEIPNEPKEQTYLLAEETNNGSIIIIGTESILVLKDDRITNTINTSLFENERIRQIASLNSNVFLITSQSGVYEVDIRKPEEEWKLYNNHFGLNMHLSDAIETIDGNTWVAQDGQILEFDDLLMPESTFPPALSLSKKNVNNKEVKLNERVFEQGDIIEFVFSNISWGHDPKIEYRLVLNSNKSNWIGLDGNKLALNQLNHGEYTLFVRSRNMHKTSAPLVFDFKIAPFWYQMRSIQLGGACMLGLMIFIFFRRRIRRSQREQVKLERLVDQKTAELIQEKSEVVKQLSEKELLLKEVNHRVKNNMQMVSSVLELQKSKTKSIDSKEILSTAISRIGSLALAHQNLYKTDSYKSIGILDYAIQIMESATKETKTQFQVDIPSDLHFHIEKAQALGFVLNELITNSVKYAWTSAQENRQILFHLTKSENTYLFTYKDNGRGFKKTDSKGLGSVLIESFVSRQLGGEMEQSSIEGAVTKIIIPCNEDYFFNR